MVWSVTEVSGESGCDVTLGNPRALTEYDIRVVTDKQSNGYVVLCVQESVRTVSINFRVLDSN